MPGERLNEYRMTLEKLGMLCRLMKQYRYILKFQRLYQFSIRSETWMERFWDNLTKTNFYVNRVAEHYNEVWPKKKIGAKLKGGDYTEIINILVLKNSRYKDNEYFEQK